MPVNNSAKQNTPIDLPNLNFAKRSFLLISSSAIRLAVQLTVIFLYSRNLSYTDYGIYQSTWLYINVISVIAVFGLPSLLLSVSVKSIKNWIAANIKLFILFLSLVNIIPLLYLFFTANNYGITTKILLIGIAAVQNVSAITETLAVKKEKEKLVLISSLLFSAGYLFCHLYLLYTTYSLLLLLTGIIILYVLKTATVWFFGRVKIDEDGYLPGTNTGMQWFYLGLNDVLSIVFKWLDKWVILFFVSVSEFAIYFNGSYEIPVFGLMLTAAGNIMLVELSKTSNSDATKIKSLFESSTLLLAAIVFPSFCFLFFYSTEFFTLIFGSKYTAAIPVFVISIFVLPVRITYFTAVLQARHRSDLIVKGAVLDLLVAIILMAALYPILQMQGLALAFVVSTYIQAGYYLWHTGKIINRRVSYFFPFKKLFILLILSIVISGAGYYGFAISGYPSNMVLGIILCLLLIVILLFYYYKAGKEISVAE